jgi:hypothetical protein
MIRRAWVFLIVSSMCISVSFAQGSVGGPKKNQNYVGGPTAQKNPVVPIPRGNIAVTSKSASKTRK